MNNTPSQDFTLIEMSIVLVVIGLIVGGVLVGWDLIRAAAVRAQISQIEKYNTAVNTFRGKYQAIPGDMNIATAEQFGFAIGNSCTGIQGQRDGNGLIDGWSSVAHGYFQWQTAGETALFWQDISSAHFIDGTFPNGGGGYGGTGSFSCTSPGAWTSAQLPYFFPPAKIGHGNWVYVYETNGANWFGLLAFTSTDGNGTLMANGSYQSGYTLPVAEAYAIDKKVDDGLPTAGNVQAFVIAHPQLNGADGWRPV